MKLWSTWYAVLLLVNTVWFVGSLMNHDFVFAVVFFVAGAFCVWGLVEESKT